MEDIDKVMLLIKFIIYGAPIIVIIGMVIITIAMIIGFKERIKRAKRRNRRY